MPVPHHAAPNHPWIVALPYTVGVGAATHARASVDARIKGRNYHIGLWIPRDSGDDREIYDKAKQIADLLNELQAIAGQEWQRRDILTFPEMPNG